MQFECDKQWHLGNLQRNSAVCHGVTDPLSRCLGECATASSLSGCLDFLLVELGCSWTVGMGMETAI